MTLLLHLLVCTIHDYIFGAMSTFYLWISLRIHNIQRIDLLPLSVLELLDPSSSNVLLEMCRLLTWQLLLELASLLLEMRLEVSCYI